MMVPCQKLFTLPNGLTVILEENHAAPVLAFNALVKVGSGDETDEEAGLCHAIEHMLFKGTKNRKVGEIARDVEVAGGDINAYTSYDQTVYYINMSKRFADKGLEILADAIQNPVFDAEELEKEKEVILEEIRRERDNPARHVTEILFQKAFQRHGYRRPIIGFNKTVKSFTRDLVFQFYNRWYLPSNTIVIVVGDFETDAILKKIERSFTGWSLGVMSHESRVMRASEPPQLKPYIEIQTDNIQSLHFSLGFHIPPIAHQDIPAVDILSHILGGATSSRLEQVLKEQKRLVQSIYAYAYAPKDPGLLMIGGNLNTAQAAQTFEILWKEIDRIKADGVSAEELQRAKLNIRSGEIYEKETVGGQAGKLAYFLATAGHLDFEEKYYQRIQGTAAREIAQAAQTYLLKTNMTGALLVPKKDNGKTWGENVKAIFESPTPVKKFSFTPPPKDRIKRIALPNGIKLILQENHTLPIVSCCLASLGGLLSENRANNGIGHVLAQCLTKGTQKRSALEVAKAIESMAGNLEGFSGKNSTGLKTEFLGDYLREGTDLFFECLLEPLFDAKEVAKEKKLTLEAIKNQEDALSSLAFFHFQKALFDKHPYGMRTLGSKSSIAALTPQSIRRHHQKLWVGNNMVMGVVGDFSAKDLANRLKDKLHPISKKDYSFSKPKKVSRPAAIQRVIINKEKEQAHVVLGFLGSTLDSPDHAPLTVLTHILSGMGGRLFLELRDKLSLAYSITCVLQEGVDPGYFAVYMGTEPSKIPAALKGIERELKKIASELVSAEELEKTKSYLVGTYELELQKYGALAQWYAFNELYGLGFEEVYRYPEKILKVTREDVLRVAKKYIDLEAYVLSIVQP